MLTYRDSSFIKWNKKAMIIGIILSLKDKNNRYAEYDYIGVIYPEGFFCTDTMFMIITIKLRMWF